MTNIINQSITLQGKAHRIYDFVNGNNNFFFSIAKPTAWPDDTQPPLPPVDLRGVPEPILIKRVLTFKAARITDCPTSKDILCDNVWYRLYDLDDLLIDGTYFEIYPTHLYLATVIKSTDYTEPAYRVTGLHTNVTFNSGIPTNKQEYLPSEIKSTGLLHWVAYSTPIARITNKSHSIQTIIKL
jgi:hypothetical protein